MRHIARLAIRRPILLLALWGLALIVSLFFVGAARDNLHQTNLQIPGTEADRAAKLSEEQFGGSISLAILLQAPPGAERQLINQGRRLVDRLQRIDGVQVLSPFAIGGDPILEQPDGQVLLTLQVDKPSEQISNETYPAVVRELDKLRPPVKADVSGRIPLIKELNKVSLDSLDQGELIALPVLIILLLLVFRSVAAAAVPLLCGFGITFIGTGAMAFLNNVFELDALALNMLTMIGLALGVDYSLLMVSRFREELDNGLGVEAAVEQATARAGRTVTFAGTALATGMLGALLIAPGNLLISATIGVLVACALAVTSALFAIPAALFLLGTNINRGTFWSAKGRRNPWVAFSERMSAKPGLAILLTLIPLALMAGPAVALDTGPPNVANLPADNAARKSYEDFEQKRGSGWAAPYEVMFHTRGPITTERRLRELKRFQLQAAKIRGVEAVLGPASLLDRTAVLRELTRQVSGGDRQLTRLERGLRRLLIGTGHLRNGLDEASAGSSSLSAGLDQAAATTSNASPGAHELATGIEQAGTGASRINNNTKRAASGSSELQAAVDELSDTLKRQARDADSKLNQPLNSAQSSVQAALRELGSASPQALADPNVAKAKQDVQSALSYLATLKTNVSNYTTETDTNSVAAKEIARGAARLSGGLSALATGTNELDAQFGQAVSGAGSLAIGVDQLSGGLQQLAGTNGGGAKALAAGIEQAASGSNQIGRGLRRLFDGVVAVRQTSDRQQAELRRQGTDLRKASTSGFFVLAGIEGARAQTRTNASFAINAPGGGNTARVIVVPVKGPFDPQSSQIRPDLEKLAGKTAERMRAKEIVGGPAVLLDDFDQATSARFPWLVITLVVVTFLVLLVLFRAPVLALCAVLLNLVTVGAAVGVLIVCFQWSESIFGGPGYLDAIALSGIFAIIFGLSIDYEVFLLSRLIEGRALTGTTEGAISYGLEKTATIITGAAAIMTGVFLAFAISPVGNTRQFGIGLTVAVILDATVVRLILLPALIRFFGERTWAVPAALDRILPRFSTH